MDSKFLKIVLSHVKVDTLSMDETLRDQGLDSFAAINLLLAIEEEYDFMYDDEFLVEDTYSTVSRLWEITSELIENKDKVV